MKHTLLDKSFEALYQNLDDIKALKIKRAWDELDNIFAADCGVDDGGFF